MWWEVNVTDTEHIRSGFQANVNTPMCSLPLLALLEFINPLAWTFKYLTFVLFAVMSFDVEYIYGFV